MSQFSVPLFACPLLAEAPKDWAECKASAAVSYSSKLLPAVSLSQQYLSKGLFNLLLLILLQGILFYPGFLQQVAFISCSTDLASQQARAGWANQQRVCMDLVVVVILKSILVFCAFENRLLTWFGPVDLQAMPSECQNLALKKAGWVFRAFGEESECFLIGYLTVCSSHAELSVLCWCMWDKIQEIEIVWENRKKIFMSWLCNLLVSSLK